ncbi:MAG TPA: branched-chain amino acid ABC transporter permease, partial [Burkholderiales bacterium]|nr:branched-chain amino acid ABC transporter permease [Burkholderiales bacterium]
MRAIGVFLVLAAFPLVMQAMDAMFYVSLASRILIYAIAATSLNLVLGYGGMVSFGHAAFFGAGAFVVGIMAVEGVRSAWIAWPAAIAVAALAAFVIGALSLRTRGVYFIMITLAFAQMIYYIFVSLKAYGGDDGLSLPGRSTIGVGTLGNDLVWYYVVLGILAVVLYGL